MNNFGKKSGWVAGLFGLVAIGVWLVSTWQADSPDRAREDVDRPQVEVAKNDETEKSESRTHTEPQTTSAPDVSPSKRRVPAKKPSTNSSPEDEQGFQLHKASSLLEVRTQQMLSTHPRAYQAENVRDLARALRAVEEARREPENTRDMEAWNADYFALQNAYFQGVSQLQGIQRPSRSAQQRLDEYAEQARELDVEERKRLKAELLYEQPMDETISPN